ncbi:neuroglobin-like [Saccoglossus kowalevskii]|uniref:Neuroglobin-1-like n=1 Tax=Saccoglossus kowalevskii TaxID=10224 RepID=A0ABM0MTV3_SACKO|nr:PREDICTED: neuroglobin-1-like [Saccoglossus kowalevskii]
MGCSVSTSTENGKNFVQLSDSVDIFTERQRRIVRKTWRPLANDMTGNGTKVFLHIFEMNPKVKQLFPCRDKTGEELLKDLNFKGHASRFMQSVGAAVDNLDNLETSLAPLLMNLGKSHNHFSGFELNYFDSFTGAMLHVWELELQDRFTPEVMEAWKLVFDYMMGKMKDGYITRRDEKLNETNEQKNKIIV